MGNFLSAVVGTEVVGTEVVVSNLVSITLRALIKMFEETEGKIRVGSKHSVRIFKLPESSFFLTRLMVITPASIAKIKSA